MRSLGIFRRGKKSLSLLIMISLLAALFPFRQSQIAEGASQPADKEVWVGQAKLGNQSVSPDNMFINFVNNVPGFSYEQGGVDTAGLAIGTMRMRKGGWIELTIDIGANEQLKQLAASGQAEVEMGWANLYWSEEGFPKYNYQGTDASMSVITNGVEQELLHGRAWDGGIGSRSVTADLKPNSIIKIRVEGIRDHIAEKPVGTDRMYVRFKDTKAPVLSSYSFTGDGLQRWNENVSQQELYVKKDEKIDLTYRFSEPVRPSEVIAGASNPVTDAFLRHPLFVNTAGTGLPAQEQQQYLVNQQYTSTAASLAKYYTNITYRYTGIIYHNSGNLPVEPGLTAPTNNNPGESLYEKFQAAEYVDAAGNAARIDFTTLRPNDSSDPYLQGKAVNDPFNYDEGGFRIIVDAVRPKYTKTGNGIQPEILTGVTVNNNDVMYFLVQFSEEVVPWRNHNSSWEAKDTYLLFNNGMKAYYESGSGTDKWLFKIVLEDDKTLETPLLKVIELAHNSKPSDTLVLQDYAGNLLLQPANYKGIHTDGNETYMDSTIDWANLMIDNTPPTIQFFFEAGGASNNTYQRNGKATIAADDSDILVPPLDPDNPGVMLPSRGIYRPSNMTGASAPTVGLVYYIWSQSAENPFDSKAADNYAAIKRYSLTGKQPREDLYKSAEDAEKFASLNLAVANNKTNMIAPPDEALLADNSGIWYLHAWTADMTWDSARELAQYEKMKSYITTNPVQYQAWKDEQGGSEADQTAYANAKALAAVGDYANLDLWKLSDFMQEDSNWTYGLTPFLLDNKAPAVDFTNIDGNSTAEAVVSVKIADPHSGLQNAYFQFAKAGEATSEAAWQALAVDGNGEASISTLNQIPEDGKYTLHVRASDKAGNMLNTFLAETIIVDSSSIVKAAFLPDSNSAYEQKHDIKFYLSGLEPESVAYAWSSSINRPTSESAYKTVTASVYRQAGEEGIIIVSPSGGGEYEYDLSSQDAYSGQQYVHVVVNPGAEDRIYTYSKVYYFDNEPPVVGFSRNGVAYPQESHEVTVTIAEEAGRAAVALRQYQWVADGAPAPDPLTGGWLGLPLDGKVILDAKEWLNPGETANYRLYVLAGDAAGNQTVASTELFSISLADSSTPSGGSANLIYMYGDETDGYTGIINLNLDTPDKKGYEYSLSTNGGQNWSKWQPYTNFISTKLPSSVIALLDMKIKYRVNGGEGGDPVDLQFQQLSETEPVYALATANTVKPVSSTTGVNIEIKAPLGIRVKAAEDNPPSGLEQMGSSFKVRENGYYAFNLTDLANPSRTGKLYIAIGNIDDTPPIGSIYYMSTTPTNGNAVVKLESNEPVTVLNNSGRNTYTFTENGSFTFQFADEAGNIAEQTATVSHIDKTPPNVRIVRSYQYGMGSDQTFGTIENNQGEIIAANGVVLSVEKSDPAGKDFNVVGGSSTLTITKNGAYSFAISDTYGNTTLVNESITHLIANGPEPAHIEYSFVDEDGNELSEDQIVTIDGKRYAKGKQRLTISGQTESHNPVFLGTRPSRDDAGQYTNRISDAEGRYSFTRVVEGNGSVTIALVDLIGNVGKASAVVEGLDNTAPEISLKSSFAGILQNQANFDAKVDLGGYTVTDNVSAPENIKVTVSGLDLSKTGRQSVTYTAVDQVGNSATAVQDVYVLAADGIRIFANDRLISSSLGETAIFDTNKLTFNISGFDKMKVGGVDMINQRGTYDVFYQSGLYREGQMKSIATKLTYAELTSKNFTVAFPKAGWYTIIVRNQEREREYATFFVSSVK
ncbi:hypothetical protein A7K91_07740 [Paenibacillus oryzae]|uniref:Uncharacterized protein n=1 Tax=Paenibacillus oryzae TaxID=1844972 RepID=A0A1A5YRA6_9BACL|nr:Ig-like domain repeat protein [Paenibacillus oryzae]OBR68098.1 hypothetical protein A7K91_07740 [Paenibacillus oryzae]